MDNKASKGKASRRTKSGKKPAKGDSAGVSAAPKPVPIKGTRQVTRPISPPPVHDGAGRPTDISADLIGTICDLIQRGNYREVAAQQAGIDKRTLFRWMARGKKEKTGIYAEFCHAVLEAESKAETGQVDRVISGGIEDPKHAEWWLERKFPERWSGARQELNRLRKDLNALIAQLGANYRGNAVAPAEVPASPTTPPTTPVEPASGG